MASIRSSFLRLAAPLALCAIAAAIRPIPAVEVRVVNVETEIAVNEVGGAVYRVRYVFPSARAFQETRNAIPDPSALARRILNADGPGIFNSVEADYSAQARSVAIRAFRPGFATLSSEGWRARLDFDAEPLLMENGNALFYRNIAEPPAVVNAVSTRIILPDGARDISFDRGSRLLRYSAPLPSVREPGEGGPTFSFRAREAVMSAAATLYADPRVEDGAMWVAKTVLEAGESDLTGVSIRYRIDGVTEWRQSDYPIVPAGGAVVDCYYPALPPRIHNLRRSEPAVVEMRYSYLDANGQLREAAESKRIRLLDRDLFLFANSGAHASRLQEKFGNARLLVGYIDGDDTAVRELAAMARAAADGMARGEGGDSGRLAFLSALYSLLAANSVTATGESGLPTLEPISAVKHPRDVLRDKAGSCLDVTLLFLAACKAENIPAGLGIVDDSPMAVALLSSGTTAAIDLSGLAERIANPAESFAEARAAGDRRLAGAEPGKYVVAPISDAGRGGIVFPKLPALPEQILPEWGYRAAATPAGKIAPGRAIGTWRVDAVERMPSGPGQQYPIEVKVAGTAGTLTLLQTGDSMALSSVEIADSEFSVAAGYETTAGMRRVRLRGMMSADAWDGDFAITGEDGKNVAEGTFSAVRGDPGTSADVPDAASASTPAPARDAMDLSGSWEGWYGIGNLSYRMAVQLHRRGDSYDGEVTLTDEKYRGSVGSIAVIGSRARLIVAIPGDDGSGGRHILRMTFDGAVVPDGAGRWQGNYAAEIADADGLAVSGTFEMRRNSLSVPAPPATAARGAGDRFSAPSAEAEQSWFTGVWLGRYGATGSEQSIRFEIGRGDGAVGRVLMPDDNIVAVIDNIQADGVSAIVSASWAVGRDNAVIRLIFTGAAIDEMWTGDFALYVVGSNQPVSSGRFCASRLQ